jgi:hypothetical protein
MVILEHRVYLPTKNFIRLRKTIFNIPTALENIRRTERSIPFIPDHRKNKEINNTMTAGKASRLMTHIQVRFLK